VNAYNQNFTLFGKKDHNSYNVFFSIWGNFLHLISEQILLENDDDIIHKTFENLLVNYYGSNFIGPVTAVQVPSENEKFLNYRGVHAYGLNWSRAWSIKSAIKVIKTRFLKDEKKDEEKDEKIMKKLLSDYESALQQHYDHEFKNFENVQKIKDKEWLFFAYNHWVPQFAIYAYTDFVL